MIPEWSAIRLARDGRSYILTTTMSRLQEKYFKTIAKFISTAVVAASQAAYAVSMETVRELERVVSKDFLVRLSNICHPMVSRDRANDLYRRFHGPLPEMRGEL